MISALYLLLGFALGFAGAGVIVMWLAETD
jgi:hypothetical protein